MTATPYETTARYRKALRLADFLESTETGIDPAALTTEGRRAAEKIAMVRTASESTWALVGEILRTRAEVRRLTANDTEANVMGRL